MLKLIRSYSPLIFILSLMSGIGHAEKPGIPFLDFQVGAEAQALGGAVSTQVNDASAIHWNSSRLSYLKNSQIFFYHSQFQNDMDFNYFSFAQPNTSSKMGWGVSYTHFGQRGFQGRNEEGEKTADFSATDKSLAVGLGGKIGARQAWGLAFKSVESVVASYRARGYAMDISAFHQFSGATAFSASVRNIGPRMSFFDESFALPSVMSFGFSHEWVHSVVLSLEMQHGLVDHSNKAATGFQLNLGKLAAVRFGYLTSLAKASLGHPFSDRDQVSGIAAGGGLTVNSATEFDYAFVPQRDGQSTHHLSLVWRLR